jgi:hypothetical protein
VVNPAPASAGWQSRLAIDDFKDVAQHKKALAKELEELDGVEVCTFTSAAASESPLAAAGRAAPMKKAIAATAVGEKVGSVDKLFILVRGIH